MKISVTIKATGIALLLLIITAFTMQNSSTSTEEFCRLIVLENINGIEKELKISLELVKELKSKTGTLQQLKDHYRIARKYFKEIEFFIEYYSPFEAKFYINGPLVPKIEMEISSIPFEPQGFQVVEENLFDESKTDPQRLKKELELLLEKFSFLKQHYITINIESNKLNEAIKLQLVRIMCLTLNGYDCTINKEAIVETKYCLDGLEKLARNYKNEITNPGARKQIERIVHLLKKAKGALEKNPDSDSFDRLNFIVNRIDPVFSAFVDLGRMMGLLPSQIHYAVRLNSASFFETDNIDKQHFSVYVTDTTGIIKQAELGKLLFYDPVLSGNNKRACASCHQNDKAFTDGLDKSLAYDGIKKITRNAPTLINAAYQKLYFHDGRVFNLEEQAGGVFNNVFEMNTSTAQIIRKLKQSDEYRSLFKEAFKGRQDTSVSFYAVIKSITEFIKTLDSRNSRFDQYLKGHKRALNKKEKNGFNLFAGKALCASCHFFPLFNGTVPPMYNDNEFEVLGVPEKENGREIDPDIGREMITRSDINKYAFKTPTVRNIELTAPYMHNGAYKNLDSVLTFYNNGGGAGLGIKIENQTLPFDSLSLSKNELNDIRLFLLTLTDVSSLPKAPVRLPKFKDPDLNNRKIGGEY